MAQVREVIELLTKILRENGTTKIKAEIFRLAKFDKDEAVVPLWKLLFELIYFLENGTIDDVVIRAFSQLTTEEMAIYVKQKMQNYGFLSRSFSLLPNDMLTGSRELLLALAWLLCTKNIIEKFMEKCSSPIDDDIYEFQRDGLDQSTNSSQLSHSLTGKLTAVQKVQQLQQLNGKLRFSLRQLYALQSERTRIQHRIHESTQGVSLSGDKKHLSVMEVYLLRNPEHLKKILRLLEKDNERLQNLLHWKEQEDVFWKWMESVLDMRLKNLSQSEQEERDTKPMVHYNIPPDIIGQMHAARKNLEAAIMKYESIIEHLEELWETKRRAITEPELNNLLAAINEEIAYQRATLGIDHEDGFRYEGRYQEPRLVLFKNDPSMKSTNLRQQRSESNTLQAFGVLGSLEGLDMPTDIQTEIAALEKYLHRMEIEASGKQRGYLAELDKLAERIPDAICIQPKTVR
ncbi:hypothetical protein CHS0354_024237 [Potamilus streckersoni]|uniref:Tubulin epsilon and delta complex protein 1 domain-containing protein n=1 Tax=Potamilus streckersoni TaxID=2493646 RepID=A0AAE0SB42_9BIVA|nr:hypothetical protein CHS0354_024237 [Potamilus streckersoni]